MNRVPRYDAELSPQDASNVRRLIPQEFFVLESTAAKNRRPDIFLHEISVEDEGRQRRVMLSDADIPATLRPFVEWLQHRAGVT
jgi:hypothetical protein